VERGSNRNTRNPSHQLQTTKGHPAILIFQAASYRIVVFFGTKRYRIVVDALILPNRLVCWTQFKFGYTFPYARCWGCMDDEPNISVAVQVDMLLL